MIDFSVLSNICHAFPFFSSRHAYSKKKKNADFLVRFEPFSKYAQLVGQIIRSQSSSPPTK